MIDTERFAETMRSEGPARLGTTVVPRILFIATHPIQYQAPLFAKLANRLGEGFRVVFHHWESGTGFVDHDFGVRFTWDIPLCDGYEHEFLYEKPPSGSLMDQVRLWRKLVCRIHRAGKPVVVANGWPNIASVATWASLVSRQIPVVQFCEANLLQRAAFGRSRLNGLVLGLLLRRTSACCFIGKRNRAFLQHHGVEPARQFHVPYSVDNARFAAEAARLRTGRSELLREYGVPDDGAVSFLFCGKIIQKKRVFSIVEAFRRSGAGARANLFIVGDGAQRSDIETLVATHGLSRVRLLGFFNQKEMPKAYALGDVLLLVSDARETWGLVVNEAMACGLPAIVSNAVGCAPDLVEGRDGAAGWTVQLDDVDALASLMREIANDPAMIQGKGAMARRRVESHTFDAMADGIIEAALHAAEKTR